jgi:o-succinylbenzoate synthase
VHFSLHPYRLPLTAPLALKGVTHTHREGVLLRLQDARGNVGWGDCAPLPGFSRETLAASREQLAPLAPWLKDRRPTPAWGDLDDPIHDEIDELALHPSARFALDLALLDVASRASGTPLPNLLHPDPEVSLPLNALLAGGARDELLERAFRLAEAGYRTLKIKVGRDGVDADVALVHALRQRVGPDIGIRCDANQAWTMNDAATFAEGIVGLGIEYVEEPLQHSDKLSILWFDTGMPVALDESLALMDPVDLQGKGYATAAVLKPTILGGVIRTLRFAEQAQMLGIRPVISGAFESGVAMRAHVAIAAASGGAPAGLDPYNRLVEDVLRPRLALGRPVVDVPSLFRGEHEVVIS